MRDLHYGLSDAPMVHYKIRPMLKYTLRQRELINTEKARATHYRIDQVV